jgi:hypothetical protein
MAKVRHSKRYCFSKVDVASTQPAHTCHQTYTALPRMHHASMNSTPHGEVFTPLLRTALSTDHSTPSRLRCLFSFTLFKALSSTLLHQDYLRRATNPNHIVVPRIARHHCRRVRRHAQLEIFSKAVGLPRSHCFLRRFRRRE